MKNSFILFDFDGVIADSYQQAFNVAKMICPPLTEEAYRKGFEGNINDWEQPIDFHTEECRHDIDFFSEFIPRMKEEVQIVPEIESVITELEQRYFLVVISSTITSPIREFLEKHRLASHFDQIMGNDIHKSKIEKIRMVFEKHGVEANNCVFITDTLGDMHEATKMEVGSIGVTWGFHPRETLLKGNPFRLVDTPAEISGAVNSYFKESRLPDHPPAGGRQ